MHTYSTVYIISAYREQKLAKFIYTKSVLDKIHKDASNSEILITYVQLGIIALITIFYAVAPKGFEGLEVIFQPVPYALGFWLAVLIIRFIFAYSRRMSGILVHLFTIVDVAMLIILIWSYSVQYQTTLALSLKAPTFVFLFFFIYLRGLRLEIQYVITGYIAAVVGWGVVTFIAYQQGPVTHSFGEYTTTHTVLLGAEIEKVLALTATGAIVTLAVLRSRRTLALAHQQGDVVRNLSLFFSQNVVKRIAAENETIQPGKGEERQGVVMNIDIRSFTKFSAMHSASDVVKTISDYQKRVVPVIQRNSGSIDKFMGDGILIHFGIVDDSVQYAASAMKAAEEIISAIHLWNQERVSKKLEQLAVGIGIDIGSVIFGTVGDESRLEFTIIGNAVNVSSKLEKATKNYPGHILATKQCYDTARGQGYIPTHTPFLIKQQQIAGSEPIDVVTLLTNEEKNALGNKKR